MSKVATQPGAAERLKSDQVDSNALNRRVAEAHPEDRLSHSPFSESEDYDAENIALAASGRPVDDVLKDFYGNYPWPWQPTSFNYVEDPGFEATMINQDIGDWEHRRLPENAAIWVAGCGTNQALQVALKFPRGTVVGSDVSMPSLELAETNAGKLGITNLTLKQESINEVSYKEQFDYVISTGVIHHNAEPRTTLKKLSDALRPTGILELMVYNRFHRMLNSSFQKALRILGDQQGRRTFDSDFQLARKVAANFPVQNQMAQLLAENRNVPDAEFADRLINPIEHSYTIESLEALGASCNLEIQMPCVSTYAKFNSRTIDWNLRFDNHELQSLYDSMPDRRRWQVSNLLLHEQSPLLWFYFQRSDYGQRKTEQQMVEEFLDRAFKKSVAKQKTYIRNGDEWALAPQAVPYPLERPEKALEEVYGLADGANSMKRILKYVGIETTFQAVNRTRIRLTTTTFPYLRAVK